MVSLAKMIESPMRNSACQIFLPLGSGARNRSSAPNAFFQVSIASAQPSTVSAGVTVCNPSGIALGMCATSAEAAHPTPTHWRSIGFFRISAQRAGDQAHSGREQPEHEQRVEQAGGRPVDGETHQHGREDGEKAADGENPAELALAVEEEHADADQQRKHGQPESGGPVPAPEAEERE